jgi:hypothetical protein
VARRLQTGIAAVETALCLLALVPVILVGLELGGLVRADLALRSTVRAGVQAGLLSSPTNWKSDLISAEVRRAARANADASSLPGFSDGSLQVSVRCACPAGGDPTEAICSQDLGGDTDGFLCTDGGVQTPPLIYVHVQGVHAHRVSLLPSPTSNGLFTLTRVASARIQ